MVITVFKMGRCDDCRFKDRPKDADPCVRSGGKYGEWQCYLWRSVEIPEPHYPDIKAPCGSYNCDKSAQYGISVYDPNHGCKYIVLQCLECFEESEMEQLW